MVSLYLSLQIASSLTVRTRLIEGFQRGETPTFIAHIRAGLEILAQDPDALLIFSG